MVKGNKGFIHACLMGAFLLGVSYWVSTSELKAAFKPAEEVEEKEERVIEDTESKIDKGEEHTDSEEDANAKESGQKNISEKKERADQPQTGRPELKNVPGWKSESERLTNKE